MFGKLKNKGKRDSNLAVRGEHEAKAVLYPPSYGEIKVNEDESTVTVITQNKNKKFSSNKLLSQFITNNKSFASIQRISINSCDIGSDGCKLILEALQKNNNAIVHLELKENNIGENGAKLFKEFLRENQTLKTLILAKNRISDGGLKSLAKGLAMNSRLSVLDVSRNAIGDAGVRQFCEAIENNGTLKSLNLSGNDFEEQGAKALGEWLKINRGLERINISECQIKRNGAVDFCFLVLTNRTLTEIIMEGCNIANKGAVAVADMIKAVDSLKYISVANNFIIDSGMSHITEALASTSHVKGADLSSSVLSDPGCRYVGACLEISTSLTMLTLKGSGISDHGAQYIASSLFSNCSLKRLYLSGNVIGDAGAASIAQSLTSNATLQTLDLSSNQIKDAGAVAFESLLLGNKSLTELSLAKNPLSEKTIDRINAAAVFCPGITIPPLDSDTESLIEISRQREMIRLVGNLIEPPSGVDDVGESNPGAPNFIRDGNALADEKAPEFRYNSLQADRIELPPEAFNSIDVQRVELPSQIENGRSSVGAKENFLSVNSDSSLKNIARSQSREEIMSQNYYDIKLGEKKENFADKCIASMNASTNMSLVNLETISSAVSSIVDQESTIAPQLERLKNDVLQGSAATVGQKSAVVLSAILLERPWEKELNNASVTLRAVEFSAILSKYELVDENLIKEFLDAKSGLAKQVLLIEENTKKLNEIQTMHQRWISEDSVRQTLELRILIHEDQVKVDTSLLTKQDLLDFKESGQWLRDAGSQYLSTDEEVNSLVSQLQSALEKKKGALENFAAAVGSFVTMHEQILEKTENSIDKISSLAQEDLIRKRSLDFQNSKSHFLHRSQVLDNHIQFFRKFEEVQARILDIDDSMSNLRRDIELSKNRKKPTNELEFKLSQLRQNSEDLRVQARLDINLHIDDTQDKDEKKALGNFFKEFLQEIDASVEERKNQPGPVPRKAFEIPEEFLCPISYQLMEDPVMITESEDGVSYERSAIEEWLKKQGTNPLTRALINNSKLTPNRALKALIESFKLKNM